MSSLSDPLTFTGAEHNLLISYDAVVREILSDFFNDPERICYLDRMWNSTNWPIALQNVIVNSETKEETDLETGSLVKFFDDSSFEL